MYEPCTPLSIIGIKGKGSFSSPPYSPTIIYLPPFLKRLVPNAVDCSEPTKSIATDALPPVISKTFVIASSSVGLIAADAPFSRASLSFSSSTSTTIGLQLNAALAICNPIMPTPPIPMIIKS